MAVCCVISLIVDVMTGSAGLPAREVLQALFSPSSVSSSVRVIVWSYRLPVSLMAVVIGAALGTAGLLMQTILHNPLASPYTLGIGAAAGFGATLAIVLGLGTIGVSFFSFLFAMSVCGLIYVLGKRMDMSGGTFVLVGIAMLFLFQSLQALLQYGASETQNQSIVFWSFGSLQKSSWQNLGIAAVVTAVCLPLIYRNRWQYNALLLGDRKAESLGVELQKLRLQSFFLVSLLAAVSVCFTGSIGFIGLAGPHIARKLVGDNASYALPASALCGSVILSVSSIISKIIKPGLIFPIGIVTSLIGAPVFFLIIRNGKGGLKR